MLLQRSTFWQRYQRQLWIAFIALIAATYVGGLNSPYAPTNGDEMVYIHIARKTAESGHWLPLQSELPGTRNTKPPLLFWQAMVAGQWGESWSLFSLRLPSVLYSFASAALVALFSWKVLHHWRAVGTAVALYLLYFSTFRYGRAYLTSAPETFWLALPMWWVLWHRLRHIAEPIGARPPILTWNSASAIGVCMGLGAAYKSFALVAPTAAAVWCAVLLTEPTWRWKDIWRTSLQLGWSAVLGLGIFALWFALDPQPESVWQEFILAENAGKMSAAEGYWHAALYGAYPMWTQLFAYPANAGLLALLVIGFVFACATGLWRSRSGLNRPYEASHPALRVVAVWLLVWLIVFTIPNQRSERYVIPAMPALAIAMAWAWDRIHKIWFIATALLLAPALLMLGRIAWTMHSLHMSSAPALASALMACAVGGICVVIGLFHSAWRRTATLAACVLVYLSFGCMVAPLSAPEANYDKATQARLQGHRVAVPNGFTGQYERFQFVLPGAMLSPYDAEGRNTGELYPDMPEDERLLTLLRQFDAVVWLQDKREHTSPSCLPQCAILGERWHVKSRHKEGEVTWTNLWYPDVWLFRREWLLSTRFAHPSGVP